MSASILNPAGPEALSAGDPRDQSDQSDRANGAASPSTAEAWRDVRGAVGTIHHPPSTPTPALTASPLTAALVEACRAMLKLTGGSQYWTGETRDALELMETALKGVRP